MSHNKEMIFAGDFNINYHARGAADTKKLKNWCNRLGFMQHIKTPTRVSQNSSSLIDLIMTKMEHCTNSGVINLHISDHQPVFVIKKKIKDRRPKISFRGRTYARYSKQLLSDSLTNKIKTEFRQTTDSNECWDLMEGFLVKFLDKYCPVKTFRSKDNTPAWITHDIITLSKDRDTAWEQAKLSGNPGDWDRARMLRNWVNNSIKAAKTDFLNNELEQNKNDPRKFWRNIKGVIPDQSCGAIDIKNQLTNEAMPRDQQAQVINDFFVGIGERLAAKFGNVRVPETNNDFEGDRLELGHITQVEVLKLIDTISINKSSGLDYVNSRVLKEFLTLSSRELTMLYNNIIDTGIFPNKWKIATVTPIPKVPLASSPSDLRPISLLPVPGKLLEKYITNKISRYLEDKEFYNVNQNGFRKGKSTTNAISKFLDDVIEDLNGSKIGLAAYLDVRKAFDTINHELLLSKLESNGLNVSLCLLLRNYLSNRKQKTRLFNGLSDLKPVSIGVPQGSTLGPILFIIYVNDLFKVLEHSKAIMYADDTVLYYSNNNHRVVRKKLQTDLINVERWCLENRLSLNVSKTKSMAFMSDHNRKKNFRLGLRMNGKEIEEVQTYRYLGIQIDHKLSGEPQFTKTVQSLGIKLRTFGRIRRFLNTTAALTVYKSTILPIIDYSDLFQFLWSSKNLQKLQKMQKWALRIVYWNEHPHMDEDNMHVAANLTKLKHRRILHLLSLMYQRSKVITNLDNRNLVTRQFTKIKFRVIKPLIKKAFLAPIF